MEDKKLLEEFMDKNVEKGQKSFWWSPKRILSYNALFNFVIGNRGGGKTFGFKSNAIKDALLNGNQFLYLRRTEIEMKDATKNFFDDIVNEGLFEGYAFKYREKKFQVIHTDENGDPLENEEWMTIGHAACLSGARSKKSVAYPKVSIICFDEFLLPKSGINSYLKDEVTYFLEFYDTVARMRDVRVLFLANAMSFHNPYFQYFGLHVPYNTDIARIKDDVVVEIVKNEAYKQAKKKTRFGKIIEGTDYEKYAIDNEFIYDEGGGAILPLTKDYHYWFTLKWDGEYFGVYIANELMKVMITDKPDKTYCALTEIQLKNGKVNKMALTYKRLTYYLERLWTAFSNDWVVYNNKIVREKMEKMWLKLY